MSEPGPSGTDPQRGSWRAFGGRLKRAFVLWVERDGGVLSAAVAYYAALSILPMLLLAFFVFDHLGSSGHLGGDVHDAVLRAIEEEASPQLRAAIEDALGNARTSHALGGPLTIAFVITTSLLVFAQIDRGIDRIWERDLRGQPGLFRTATGLLANRLRALLLLAGTATLMTAMFATSLVTEAGERVLGPSPAHVRVGTALLHVAAHLVLNTLLFSVLLKSFAPRPVRWGEVFHGSGLLALTWEIGRLLVSMILVRNHSDVYGVFGSFVVILLWIYYASLLLFYWAAYVKCLVDDRGEEPAATPP